MMVRKEVKPMSEDPEEDKTEALEADLAALDERADRLEQELETLKERVAKLEKG